MTTPSPVLKWLWVFLLLNALVLNVTLSVLAPRGFNETVLDHTRDALLGRNNHDDSWRAMREASDYLRAPHTVPVYSELFFARGLKFQYPLSSLLPFQAVRGHLDLISYFFLVGTVIASCVLFEVALRRWNDLPTGLPPTAARALLVIGLTFTFYPVVKAYTLGQVQVWIAALFTGALLCWLVDRRASAGVLIGLVSLIKPQYAFFLVWALVRREWRFGVGAVSALVVGTAASLATFAWADHVDYLNVLTFLSRHGESFHPNQSVNGVANRIAGIWHPTLYDNVNSDLFFPPFNHWVYAVTLVTSGVLLMAALLVRRSGSDRSRVLDFCLLALTATTASPIAWEHHYGVMLPIFVVLVAATLNNRVATWWTAIAYVLASNYFQVTNMLALQIWNVLQSNLLAAAFMVLGVLHVLTGGFTYLDKRGARNMAGEPTTLLGQSPSARP